MDKKNTDSNDRQKSSTNPNSEMPDYLIGDSWKVKFLMGWSNNEIRNKELDPEEDFFHLGLLMNHGLIDENYNLTEKGQSEFERLAEERISEMNAKN